MGFLLKIEHTRLACPTRVLARSATLEHSNKTIWRNPSIHRAPLGDRYPRSTCAGQRLARGLALLSTRRSRGRVGNLFPGSRCMAGFFQMVADEFFILRQRIGSFASFHFQLIRRDDVPFCPPDPVSSITASYSTTFHWL